MVKLALVAKMRAAVALGPILAFLLVAQNSGICSSAIVPKNVVVTLRVPGNRPNETKKENMTMEVLQEAIVDYLDLSDAFYSPADSESQRQKRTLRVFRTLANRTRSGVKRLRSLFSGGRNSGGDDDESSAGPASRGTFRKFFSNLLNRILVFLTNTWDRITKIFRGGGSGDGEDGEGGGNSLVKRIRTGAAALAKRFQGSGGGGSSGGLGGIRGIFASLAELNPKSTVEPYVVEYDSEKEDIKETAEASTETPEPSSSTTATPEKIIASFESTGSHSGGYSSDNLVGTRSSFSDSYTDLTDNSAASSSFTYGSFVPFPMDSDPHYHLNGAPSTYYSVSSSPWVTRTRRGDSGPSKPYYSY